MGRRPPRSGNGVLRVVRAGVATSFQDQGRAGYAHLGVPGSGAVDRRSADLVNRLVGNPPDAAVVETAGGLVLEALAPAVVADSTTGGVRALRLGDTIAVDPAPGEVVGVPGRCVEASRRSRCSARGAGTACRSSARHHPNRRRSRRRRRSRPARGDGPGTAPSCRAINRRCEWARASRRLVHRRRPSSCSRPANGRSPSTSRVGIRLSGPALTRLRADELPSEGLVTGAIQVPPDGQPVVMLADHPTTGGYPVIAVVDEADVGRVAQCPPGTTIRFRA